MWKRKKGYQEVKQSEYGKLKLCISIGKIGKRVKEKNNFDEELIEIKKCNLEMIEFIKEKKI